MKLSLIILGILLACPCPLSAQDLTKIDRRLVKEPAYQTKQVKYCLLVFGPEAAYRVWLVQDGETLYVDRNGNGDLTEPGEKIEAKKGDATDPAEGCFYFEAGDIPEGKLRHKRLTVVLRKIDHMAQQEEQIKQHLQQYPQARGCMLGLEVEIPGWKGIGLGGRIMQVVALCDAHGVLVWGDAPQSAPVLHLRGPWHLLPFSRQQMMVGRPTDLMLGVGTPGVGPGTTAYVGYEGLMPEKAYPTAEITYPPLRPGEPPLKELFELKERC